MPPQLLFYAGVSLFPFAAYLAYLGRRETIAAPLVWTVIALNALWTIDSILLLLIGWVAQNAFGYVFIVAQAACVAFLAGFEYLGLKRSEVLNASTAQQFPGTNQNTFN